MSIPMKHDPLRDGDNALLALVQSRQLGLDGIVCVGHGKLIGGQREMLALGKLEVRGRVANRDWGTSR